MNDDIFEKTNIYNTTNVYDNRFIGGSIIEDGRNVNVLVTIGSETMPVAVLAAGVLYHKGLTEKETNYANDTLSYLLTNNVPNDVVGSQMPPATLVGITSNKGFHAFNPPSSKKDKIIMGNGTEVSANTVGSNRQKASDWNKQQLNRDSEKLGELLDVEKALEMLKDDIKQGNYSRAVQEYNELVSSPILNEVLSYSDIGTNKVQATSDVKVDINEPVIGNIKVPTKGSVSVRSGLKRFEPSEIKKIEDDDMVYIGMLEKRAGYLLGGLESWPGDIFQLIRSYRLFIDNNADLMSDKAATKDAIKSGSLDITKQDDFEAAMSTNSQSEGYCYLGTSRAFSKTKRIGARALVIFKPKDDSKKIEPKDGTKIKIGSKVFIVWNQHKVTGACCAFSEDILGVKLVMDTKLNYMVEAVQEFLLETFSEARARGPIKGIGKKQSSVDTSLSKGNIETVAGNATDKINIDDTLGESFERDKKTTLKESYNKYGCFDKFEEDTLRMFLNEL